MKLAPYLPAVFTAIVVACGSSDRPRGSPLLTF